tara:strand:+ start:960 stop:1229 length:270 start_codon:yes stop_codon:yes gene_type:complete
MQGFHNLVEDAIKASRRIEISMDATSKRIKLTLDGVQGIFGMGRDDYEDLALDIEHTLKIAKKDLAFIEATCEAMDANEVKRTEESEAR